MRISTSHALMLAVLGVAAAPADAAVKKWSRPTSGAFAADDRWVTAGRPGQADSVIFDLSGGYSVRLDKDQISSRLVVGNDKVVLRLGGKKYALTADRLDALLLGRRAGDLSRMTVRDGRFDTPRSALGKAPRSQANLTVSNATWNTDGRLIIGEAGVGGLTAVRGSTVNTGSALIGAKTGAKGVVTLADRGTTLNVGGQLRVGNLGTGLISIRPGAAMNVGGRLLLQEKGQIQLQGGTLKAPVLLATGRLNVHSGSMQLGVASIFPGAAMVVTGGNLHVTSLGQYGKLAMNSPSARLAVDHLLNTGQITGPGQITGQIDNQNEVRLFSGQQLAFVGRFTNSGRVVAAPGGTVIFDGDVLGGGVFGGGGKFVFRQLLDPGSTRGAHDIQGDVEFERSGSLLLRIDADGQHDLLNISGLANLADIRIQLDPAYDGPGGFFQLLNASQVNYGGNIDLDLGRWGGQVVQTPQGLGVQVVVPEPGTASIMALAAALGLLRRHRRAL